jgi:branched-chain amino acid transport system substrate-binding protein
MKARILVAVTGVAMLAAVAVTGAGSAVKLDPGVTATSITIGGTHPITGPASLYRTISAAESAYFAYVNDHGGVNGRKINYIVKDDGYDPSKTVPLAQQLVEQDKVFAIYGSLGTAPGLATWDYLNGKKVPQVFLATGDSYWMFCHFSKCGGKKYGYTFGWQPDYPGEAKQYGKYINANFPSGKVGVLYQNDAFGKNYYAGLRVGMGAKKSNIVDAQSYDVATQSNVTQQILSMKSKGADILVIFATPTPAITALVTATKVGWTRQATFLGNVSGNRIFMLSAAGNGADLSSLYGTTYVKSSTVNKGDSGIALAGSILDQYAPSLKASFDRGDTNVVYGLAKAWTFVQALRKAGKTPTRAGLLRALENMNYKNNPFLPAGFVIKTSSVKGKRDAFPLEQLQMLKWQGGTTGVWNPFGSILNGIR